MKLSDIPWPGRVIVENYEEADGEIDDEVVVEIPNASFAMTIYRHSCPEDGYEDSSVVVRKYDGQALASLDAAYQLPPAVEEDVDPHYSKECSRYELSSLLELIAAVDFFAQKYGANHTE